MQSETGFSSFRDYVLFFFLRVLTTNHVASKEFCFLESGSVWLRCSQDSFFRDLCPWLAADCLVLCLPYHICVCTVIALKGQPSFRCSSQWFHLTWTSILNLIPTHSHILRHWELDLQFMNFESIVKLIVCMCMCVWGGDHYWTTVEITREG